MPSLNLPQTLCSTEPLTHPTLDTLDVENLSTEVVVSTSHERDGERTKGDKTSISSKEKMFDHQAMRCSGRLSIGGDEIGNDHMS